MNINLDEIKEYIIEEKKEHRRNVLLYLEWVYKDFDNSEIFNVYGHTIFEEPLINDYSSAIDLGCYHSKEKISNPRLCALEFPSMKVYTQESLED